MIVGQSGEKATAVPIPPPQNRTKHPRPPRSSMTVGQKWRYTTRMAHNNENRPAKCGSEWGKSPQTRRCRGPLTRMAHDEAPTGRRDQAAETAEAALKLGVPAERISVIAAVPSPPGGVRSTGATGATGATDAEPQSRMPGRVSQVRSAPVAGKLTVPIAAVFPIGQFRGAVTLRTCGRSPAPPRGKTTRKLLEMISVARYSHAGLFSVFLA